MRARWCSLFLVPALAIACSRPEPTREYELKGQILAIRPERNEVVIRHEDVKGFMPGMTMPFTVRKPELITGMIAGDLVTATLVVGETSSHLSTLTRTGHAQLTEAPPPPPPDTLEPGDLVKDAPLVDQDGKPRTLADLRGQRVALTFIYTRCPIPDFCPLMDRHFVALQKTIAATPALADVRLVTVTLDPQFDTPPVMKAHAARLQADPARWIMLTGMPADVAAFGEQFGVYVEKNEDRSIDIIHNLRTAVIGADGRVVSLHTGNAWTPGELLADLEKAPPAPAH